MTMHSFHPDSHEHGLADDCPRCEEHSHQPWADLDGEMIANLQRRIVDDLEPRSENERRAMRNYKAWVES